MSSSVRSFNKNQFAMLGVFAFAMAILVIGFMPDQAHAGTGGTEFASVWTTLSDWMQGILGKVATGAMILVGIIAGVVRQSLMSFAVGIGGGVGLYNAPTIIDNVLTATLSQAPAVSDTIIQLSNGLGI